jgi:hypothetical protein
MLVPGFMAGDAGLTRMALRLLRARAQQDGGVIGRVLAVSAPRSRRYPGGARLADPPIEVETSHIGMAMAEPVWSAVAAELGAHR